MKRTLAASAILFLASCMQLPGRPVPLSERGPQLLDVLPSEDQTISLRPTWAVAFSEPIDPATVGPGSVILSKEPIAPDGFSSPGDLYDAIDRGKIESVPLDYYLSEAGKVLLLWPKDQLLPGVLYTLLITARVLSKEEVPVALAQDQGAIAPFLSTYQTPDSEPAPQETPPASAPSPSPSPEGSPPAPVAPEPAAVPPPPTSLPPLPSLPPRLVLNEIYYDAVGSDTDGLLFVELYGTPSMGLGGYKVNFVNGDDGKIYDSITLAEAAVAGGDGFYLIADSRTGMPTVTTVPGADLIDNFDPQNGPDAVQLVDPAGQFVDAVGYGEGIVRTAENGLPAFEGSAAPDVINGHSLERKSLGLDTGNNSQDFVDREVPTPGR